MLSAGVSVTTSVLSVLLSVVVVHGAPNEDLNNLNINKYTIDVAKDLPATDEYDAEHWKRGALDELREKLKLQTNTGRAKNLILFLGDGMSIPTITASRIYQGQLGLKSGENEKLSFENFPHTGLSKTYCVDKQVADSACTSTAYLGGVKANYGTLGVTAAVPRGNCTLANEQRNHVQSIIAWAQAAGKGTGIVTTAAITDASPAGGYSHTSDRDWQSDKDLVDAHKDPKHCRDIAHQLIHSKPGSHVKVIMGGGRIKFLPKDMSEKSELGRGERLDGANLIEEWLEEKNKNYKAKFVHDKEGLHTPGLATEDYILGLFDSEDMKYHLEGASKQPTLEDMTSIAIQRLQQEPNGYYLFVEGALIDKAHHRNWAHRALDETVEFSKAIDLAVRMTNEEDTLIVVTADHSHTMSFSGYPPRGNDILGYTTSKIDNVSYSTLGYMNGPSAINFTDGGHHDFTKDDMLIDTYRFPSYINMTDETHGGDDVAVYARGPWSHLFIGSIEQHQIPHMMAFAAKIGPAAVVGNPDIISSSHTIRPFYLLAILLFTVLARHIL